MVLDVPDVGLEPRRALSLVARLHRLEPTGEGHLGVDHDVLPTGHPHHHVRPQQAVVGAHGGLLVEIAVLDHAGCFHHPA
jgi:hypothetical protein